MHAHTHTHTCAHTRSFMGLDKVSELLHYDYKVNNNNNNHTKQLAAMTMAKNDVYVCVYGSKERPKKQIFL